MIDWFIDYITVLLFAHVFSVLAVSILHFIFFVHLTIAKRPRNNNDSSLASFYLLNVELSKVDSIH